VVINDTADTDPGPRQRRQVARQSLAREQLLDIAESLFSDLGFDRATLKATADAAEMSIGAVYQAFSSKKELYRAVFSRRAEAFHRGLAQAVTDGPSAVARLRSMVSYVLDFYHRYPTFGRLILRHAGATLFAGMDFIDPDLSVGYEESEAAILSSIIEHGQKTGEFRSADSRTLMRIVSAVMLAHLSSDPSIVGPASQTTPLSTEDLSDLLARLLMP
jgi:AcrR family transcriptional regulator